MRQRQGLRKATDLHRQTSQNQSSGSEENIALRAQLRRLTEEVDEKRQQMMSINQKLRQQGIKNQKLKRDVTEADQRSKAFVQKQIEFFLQKYKDNKQSPLFYNENGLSPFELLKIGQSKFQQPESIICMVCFSDLQKGVRVMRLPCSHILHKQCAIQNLLYSKVCPACSESLK